MAYTPPPPVWEGVKNFRKVFAGGMRSEIFILGGNFVGGWSHNFEVKIKIV